MTPVLMPMVMIVVMVFVQYHLCPDTAHALLHDLVDHDLERIDVERLEFLIQLVDRNTKFHQCAENHVPARTANAFEMKCALVHNAMRMAGFGVRAKRQRCGVRELDAALKQGGSTPNASAKPPSKSAVEPAHSKTSNRPGDI